MGAAATAVCRCPWLPHRLLQLWRLLPVAMWLGGTVLLLLLHWEMLLVMAG
jgi:hypothetical protein